MEWGGVFILLILAIVVVVVGGVVYAIAMRGRARQLSSKGGTADARRPEEVDAEDENRPEHVKVESEQRSRFIGTR
jgi:flagellar basal body-associated protein FliL